MGPGGLWASSLTWGLEPCGLEGLSLGLGAWGVGPGPESLGSLGGFEPGSDSLGLGAEVWGPGGLKGLGAWGLEPGA